MMFFFFQAEDGIRDLTVTGVQTCALPISLESRGPLDLLVWPEAAIPGWLAEMPGWDSLFAALAREGHTPIFTGGIHAVSADVYYNAAFFYDSTGQWRPYPVYGKHYLVPVES